MISIVHLSFLFAFSELLLALIKNSKRSSVKVRDDRGSAILIWLAITFGFTGGFLLSRPVNHFWAGFGFLFIISGLIVRWIAILQLGKSFTVDVAINTDANLKTDGIYENIRHPSYLGLLLIISGFSITMHSLNSFLVFVIPVLIAVIYRISVEEKVLINEFGGNYIKYMKSTKKLIPYIY
jgi:protein-S-isoprenylcysteine O-methyltransferase Ste14